MASLYDRLRNVFRDELVTSPYAQQELPRAAFRQLSPEEAVQADRQMYNRMGEPKSASEAQLPSLKQDAFAAQSGQIADESFRLGANRVVQQISATIAAQREELFDNWPAELATYPEKRHEINARFSAVLKSQNEAVSGLQSLFHTGLIPIENQLVSEDVELAIESVHREAVRRAPEIEGVLQGVDLNTQKTDEAFRLGAASVITQVAEYLQEVRPMLVSDWAHDLQHDHERVEPQTVAAIDARNTAILTEQNALARFLRDYSEENGLAPELLPEVVDLQTERRVAYREAAYGREAEWFADLDPSNHVGGNVYDRIYPIISESAEIAEGPSMRSGSETELESNDRRLLASQGLETHRALTYSERSLQEVEGKRLGTQWSIALQRDPDQYEALADRFRAEISAFNQSLSAGKEPLSFNHIQRTVIADLETNVHEMANNYSGRDREDFLEQYSNALDQELPSLQPSRGIEAQCQSATLSPNRYEYLDVAIQQLSHATSATTAREVPQLWTISQPQQSVFVQPERAQQLAAETPEVQRDFGVSL